MGRKPWATPAQGEWLKSRKKNFINAQVEKETRAFVNATTQAFVKEWLVAEPTAQEIAEEGSVDAARKVKLEAQRTQIDYWFRNHTRNPGAGKATKASTTILPLSRKKIQLLMPYQAYMRLHSKRVMPVIKEGYEKYVKEFPEGKMPQGSWRWACKEAARMLAEDEPESVREEVEKFRQELFQEQTPTLLVIEDLLKDGLEDTMKKVRSLQSAIDMIARTGLEALNAIEDQTSWKGTLLLGGPDPTTGRLVTIAIHNGRTLDLGNIFSEATELWPDIQKAFDTFIAHSFPPELADQLETLYRGESIKTPFCMDGKNSPAPPVPVSSTSVTPITTASDSSAPASMPISPAVPTLPTTVYASPTESSIPEHPPATVFTPERPAQTELSYDEMRTLTIHWNQKWLKAREKGKTAEELQARLDAGEELTTDEEEWTDPVWMTEAYEYLVGVSKEPWWHELVSVWQAFERMMKCPDKTRLWLLTKGRPEEVKVWISRARQYIKRPKIKSLPLLVTSWHKWWARLQPLCRRQEDTTWPLLRCIPQDESEWSELKRGGCNGLFMVIMCLSWWIATAGEIGESLNDVREAVEDVIWVLRSMGCGGAYEAPDRSSPTTTLTMPHDQPTPPLSMPFTPSPVATSPGSEEPSVAPARELSIAPTQDPATMLTEPAIPAQEPPIIQSLSPAASLASKSTTPGVDADGVFKRNPTPTVAAVAAADVSPKSPSSTSQAARPQGPVDGQLDASCRRVDGLEDTSAQANGGAGEPKPSELTQSTTLPITPAKRPASPTEERTVEPVTKKQRLPGEPGMVPEPSPVV